MTERYILVTDDEYCYTLDTHDENYKTLEDFEKTEFENAKKDGIDIKDYGDAILQSASEKYWEWVYNYYVEADTCNEIMNKLYEENENLKKSNEDARHILKREFDFATEQRQKHLDEPVVATAQDIIRYDMRKALDKLGLLE